MKKLLLIICVLATSLTAQAQNDFTERPKLVVGIVVDQMRWDYLGRYYDQLPEGGLKRLIKQGYSCNNCLINYVPTVTAIGHTSIYTGTTPAYHGICGNSFYVDGRHFQSSSTMQQAPQVNAFRFVWKKVLMERMLFAELKLQDIPGENNFYFMHLYRNGIGYRWAVMNDANNPGEELQQLFNCTTERELDKDKADALKDGDRIRLEIRSIDRRTYDYFYSMQVMENSGSNPVANFSGGCLGYFSAFHVQTRNYVFSRAEIEEEGDS